jgi:hypothetical protein
LSTGFSKKFSNRLRKAKAKTFPWKVREGFYVKIFIFDRNTRFCRACGSNACQANEAFASQT